MKKWKTLSIITLAIILIVQTAYASQVYCEDTIEEDSSCIMITPILRCNTYDIINGTLNASGYGKVLVDEASLHILEGNIYWLNFSQVVGDYTIRLCDNTTTREIKVVEKSKMAWTSIILALGGMTLILGILGFSINNKKMYSIKILFFLWAAVNAFALGLTPLAITLNPADSTTFYPVAIGYFTLNAAGIVAFLYFFIFYLINRAREINSEEEDGFN